MDIRLAHLIIHLTMTLALILMLGYSKDGVDVKNQKIRTHGWYALGVLVLSLILIFIFYFVIGVTSQNKSTSYSYVWIGFVITIVAFLPAVFSETHIEKEQGRGRLNLEGILTLSLGLIAILLTVVDYVASEYSKNYVFFVGYLVTTLSGLIAIVGNTNDEKGLNNLGKVAIAYVGLGLLMSFVSFIIQENENDIDKKTLQKNLKTQSDSIINQNRNLNLEVKSLEDSLNQKFSGMTVEMQSNINQSEQKLNKTLQSNSRKAGERIKDLEKDLRKTRGGIEEKIIASQLENVTQFKDLNTAVKGVQDNTSDNFKALNTQIATTNANINKKIDKYKTELDDTSKEIQRLKKDLADLNKKFSSLSSKLGNLPEKVSALEKKIGGTMTQKQFKDFLQNEYKNMLRAIIQEEVNKVNKQSQPKPNDTTEED